MRARHHAQNRVRLLARGADRHRDIEKRLARGEGLVVHRITNTAGELQRFGNRLVIDLAERGIGGEAVTLAVAVILRGAEDKTVASRQRTQHRTRIVERIGVDEIFRIVLIVQVIIGDQEVQRAIEIGGEAPFRGPFHIVTADLVVTVGAVGIFLDIAADDAVIAHARGRQRADMAGIILGEILGRDAAEDILGRGQPLKRDSTGNAEKGLLRAGGIGGRERRIGRVVVALLCQPGVLVIAEQHVHVQPAVHRLPPLAVEECVVANRNRREIRIHLAVVGRHEGRRTAAGKCVRSHHIVERKRIAQCEIAGDDVAERGIAVHRLERQAVRQAAQHARRIAVTHLHLGTDTAVFAMAGLGHEIDRGPGRRLPPDRTADGEIVPAVDLVGNIGAGIHRGVDIVDRTVAPFKETGGAEGQFILNDRDVEGGLHLEIVVIAVSNFTLGTDLFQIRLLGDLVDRAAGGVAAVKRALRPAQNLDPFQIVIGRRRQRRAAEINVVDVHRHAAVAGGGDGGRADAANLEIRRSEIAVGKGDGRNCELQVAETFDLMRRKLIGIERRHRNGDVLNILCRFLCRDDHGFDLCRRRQSRGQQQGAHAQQRKTKNANT